MLEIFKNYFFIIPTIFLIITIVLIIRLLKRNKEYVESVGTITDFYKNTSAIFLDDYETVAISPVVTYEVNGKKFEFIGNYYSTTMNVGDKIKIMYKRNDPQKATIKKELNFAIIVLGTFTIVSFIVLIVLRSI